MIAKKLKEYRTAQNLTMKALADACGMSVGYISQLEHGQAEPSLSSLRKLAQALDVPLFLLLDTPENQSLVLRSEEHLVTRSKDGAVLYEFLNPLPSEAFMPQMLVMKFIIQPHAKASEMALQHPSEEVIYVMSGQLTLSICDEVTELKAGDSAVIKKNLPHTCVNNQDEPLVGVSCVTPPVWGNARR